jgi:hypothetical protein
MTDQTMHSNVNIDFKPAFAKPESQPSSRKSFSPRKSFRDPNLTSEKYVAHRYQDQDQTTVAIKPGEEPVKI